ncbi:MAG: Imm50 family immunity protein [Verrucomicrobiota bacterium]
MPAPFHADPMVIATIAGHERVVAYLGHWPTFHDMEVITLSLERVPVRVVTTADLRATFAISDLGKAPDDPERKQALLELMFESVDAVEIKGWAHQNAILGMSLAKTGDAASPIGVTWGGCGHDVSFRCGRIAVLSLREINPFRESLRDS